MRIERLVSKKQNPTRSLVRMSTVELMAVVITMRCIFCGDARQVVMFFFSSRRRHTRFDCDWSSDVCSSDLPSFLAMGLRKRFDHVKRVRKIGWDADAARTPDDSLFPKAGLTSNLACLEEIITHQIFSGLASFRIFVAEFLCDLLLKLKGQNVEITAGVEM